MELGQRLRHADQTAVREEAAVRDERDRFQRLREELANRLAEQEGESRRRHEAVMAQMAVEREKKLMELDQIWRQKVTPGRAPRRDHPTARPCHDLRVAPRLPEARARKFCRTLHI